METVSAVFGYQGSLGDLQGMAITWGMIGNTLFTVAHRHAEGIRYLLQGLLLLNQLGMEPHTQQAMAQDLADFRRRAGAEVFDPIWNELTHGAPLPPWLKGEEGEPGAGEG